MIPSLPDVVTLGVDLLTGSTMSIYSERNVGWGVRWDSHCYPPRKDSLREGASKCYAGDDLAK